MTTESGRSTVARFLAAGVVLLALVVLGGWLAGAPFLTRFVSASVAMRPITAVLFLVMSGVVAALASRRPAFVLAARAGAILVIAVNAVALANRLTPSTADLFGVSGMAPGTIFCFVMLGLVSGWRRDSRVASAFRQVSVASSVLLGLYVMLGFLYRAPALDEGTAFTPMAFPTALAFFCLAAALACLSPRDWPMSILFRDDSAGRVARTILASGLVVQIVIGIFRLQGELIGLYSTQLGVALMVTYNVAALSVVTLLSMWRLAESEGGREASYERLRALVAAQEALASAAGDERRTEDVVIAHAAVVARAEAAAFAAVTSSGLKDVKWIGSSVPASPKSEQLLSELAKSLEGTGETVTQRAFGSGRLIAVYFTRPDTSRQVLFLYRADAEDLSPEEFDALKIFATTGGAALAQARRLAEQDAFLYEGQAEIANLQQQFTAFMENVPAAAFIKDARGVYIYGNGKLEDFLGTDGAAFLGSTDEELLSPEDLARIELADREYAASSVSTDADARLFTDTRGRSWLLVVFPIGKSGRPFTGGIALDVTRGRRAEQELAELASNLERRVAERTEQVARANQELEAFSYSVSHDLRAPLRAITGYARLLQEDHAPQLDDEARRFITTIVSEATRMGQLIDDLLAFSRLERQPLSDAPVNVEQLAREVLSIVRQESPDREIVFSCKDVPPARADSVMLRQVLTNLISNSVKYAKPEGPISIDLRGELVDGESVYHLSDNGVGFDMAYSGKLFGVFQRLHRADQFQGTGVGLAIVHRIITRHGGRVWGEGEVGVGARFSFTLPAAVGEGAVVDQFAAASGGGTAHE